MQMVFWLKKCIRFLNIPNYSNAYKIILIRKLNNTINKNL